MGLKPGVMFDSTTKLKPKVDHCSWFRIAPPNPISHKNPTLPADIDASNMAIFDALINATSPVNAKLVMKIDIVKPMPPRSPAPKTCFQFISAGSRHTPNNTAMKATSVMPNGLPMTRPIKMPKLLVLLRSCSQLDPITMPVLARAKIGSIKKATGLCRRCSSMCDGDCASSCLTE